MADQKLRSWIKSLITNEESPVIKPGIKVHQCWRVTVSAGASVVPPTYVCQDRHQPNLNRSINNESVSTCTWFLDFSPAPGLSVLGVTGYCGEFLFVIVLDPSWICCCLLTLALALSNGHPPQWSILTQSCAPGSRQPIGLLWGHLALWCIKWCKKNKIKMWWRWKKSIAVVLFTTMKVYKVLSIFFYLKG